MINSVSQLTAVLLILIDLLFHATHRIAQALPQDDMILTGGWSSRPCRTPEMAWELVGTGDLSLSFSLSFSFSFQFPKRLERGRAIGREGERGLDGGGKRLGGPTEME